MKNRRRRQIVLLESSPFAQNMAIRRFADETTPFLLQLEKFICFDVVNRLHRFDIRMVAPLIVGSATSD
jgi:hypothetical protein